jgi:hypothetical protein
MKAFLAGAMARPDQHPAWTELVTDGALRRRPRLSPTVRGVDQRNGHAAGFLREVRSGAARQDRG